ncbi:hypothetical protein ACQJBY_032596 [Aegilops geniculata]
MHLEVKAYLDKLRVETKARYDAWDKQFELRATLLTPGAPPPPLTRSTVMASDGGLSIGTTIPMVVPDAFSATTHAREVPAVAHDASPIWIEIAPFTCMMECLTQIDVVASVDEVHDTATTIHSELRVDLILREVEQPTTAQATPSISTGASSTAKVVPPVATTTDVDPRASVQELDDSPLPYFNTFPLAASELDYNIILFVSSNLTAPPPTKCSA